MEKTHWKTADGVARVRVLGPAVDEHVPVEDLDNGGTWQAHESQLTDWRDAAAEVLAETPIFEGVENRPEVHAFADYCAFLEALRAYRQSAADAINREFSRAFRL